MIESGRWKPRCALSVEVAQSKRECRKARLFAGRNNSSGSISLLRVGGVPGMRWRTLVSGRVDASVKLLSYSGG